MQDLPEFSWYSADDVSGHYGATVVQCHEVNFGPGTGNLYSTARLLKRAGEIILEL